MFTLKCEKVHPRQLNKVNEHGEYAPFPGVTVVSACYPKQKEFCESIYKLLVSNPLIVHHFLPLPAQSYHMTTMSLETEQQIGSSWNQFIIDNLPHYKRIKQTLQDNPLYPSIEYMEVNIGRTISLSLSLPTDQEAQIKKIAKSLNIEETIPKVLHITLAYSRFNRRISHEISEQLHTEITKELNKVIEKIEFPLEIAEYKLCYFNDMTAFPSWNAENNPFIQSKSPHRDLSFIQGEKQDSDEFKEKYDQVRMLTI
ncbi:DUF1868 domain-containing protein [Legionella parisiensis]|uniref:DUF1868 domain-containing protein n=1 Tax=Legionella parisiensis TaxID=45071 RepID=A0A1E5JLW5_9GAMM|nr:DUF1868 domain-containing protein [Legionella parisiensis]KTD41310.1 hypothetical protein Lpar_2627 [Legionella parisiensis]OEH45470.1 hypothetical protein lpari_03521 [Legionella parisiensis]STX76389.1 Uncharacterized protein conserved in bacteria [Legionella parisiensis]